MPVKHLFKKLWFSRTGAAQKCCSVLCFVKLERRVLSHFLECYHACVPLLDRVVPSCQRAVDKCENTFVALIRKNSYSTSFEAAGILCAEACAAFTVTYVQYCVLYKGNRAAGKCWQRQSQVMDAVEQRYTEVGAKTEKEGWGKMNNSLTVRIKQPVLVLGAVW